MSFNEIEYLVITPTVWLQAGMVIIYGSSLDAAPHHHHAIQVIWPQGNAPYKINGNSASQLLLIDSNVEHQLQMAQGWVLLIEPKSELGKVLSRQLTGLPMKTIKCPSALSIKPPSQDDSVTELLAPLFQILELNQSLQFSSSTVEDSRIQQLIFQLNQCLEGECIKPSRWRARDVASQLALSESRFLHLFSEQLGIAWRPYLLWRRMMCAIHAMRNNSSATDAAHLAGFSDSAHLSRTFRKTFGMSIRQAHALFKIS